VAGQKHPVLRAQPLISIGLPVANGEAYVQQALTSILHQSYPRLEVIVSDNGSTDGTRDICEACAAADQRVKYFRQPTNRGAAWNFNFTYHQSNGTFFKWAAHDDLLQPDFILNTCAALLLSENVSLAYSSSVVIDANGKECEPDPDPPLRLDHADPAVRFHDAVFGHHYCLFVFGLMRSSLLRKTSLMGPYACSDIVLLAQLALSGRIVKLPTKDFHWRSHPEQSIRKVLHHHGIHAYSEWFVPNLSHRRYYPHWRLLQELAWSIVRSSMTPMQKVRCLVYLSFNNYRIGGPRERLEDLIRAFRYPSIKSQNINSYPKS
jgi:glycosyltransferase involved in cell wall biosynthesis